MMQRASTPNGDCDAQRRDSWVLPLLAGLLLLSCFSSKNDFFVVPAHAQTLLPCDRDIMCGGDRASLSMIGSNFPNCLCFCRQNFAGQWCETCSFNYTGADCSACKSGFGTLPNCVEQCTDPATSCSNHSIPGGLAPNPAGGNCSCTCYPQYAGPRCNECAPGYTKYPFCYPPCNLTCNNRANFIRGEPPNCECVCNPGYGGQYCETCAAGFTLDVPSGSCVDQCTHVNSSCMFATAVLPKPDCTCICRPGYAGSKCERCAPGYIGYPTCYDNCSHISVSCNNDGVVSVQPFRQPPFCQCQCSGLRSGTFCERCISTRRGYPLCAECNEGYGQFPLCIDVCTNVNVSCGGRALSVEIESTTIVGGIPVYNCRCACKVGYAGNTCNRCASGYGWYPLCVDACNVTSVSCAAGAYYVERFDIATTFPPPPPQRCKCFCLSRFGGESCDRCITGYSAFPSCIDNCTDVSVSCEGRATAVAFVSPGQCSCTCRKNFVGTLTKCNMCSPDFTDPGYPVCGDRCLTVEVSCNGRAFSLFKKQGDVGCVCQCWKGWGGDDCSVCARGFMGPFCTICAPGFSGPDCTDDCTNVTASCSPNAEGVGGLKPNCRCYCKQGWDGTLCDYCARGYTGENCDRCAFGFEGYPNCLDRCTETSVSCSNRALDVTGSNGNCTCFCFPGYGGRDCSVCATGFQGVYCNECQPGYSGPFCQDDCTLAAVSCNGRGLSVASINGRCVCRCLGNFGGDRCDQCKSGYINFPDCVDGCLLPNISCTRNATAVIGTYPFCQCSCTHPFAGRLCEKCAFGYAGANCERCADQFYGFPTCIDDCTNVTASCGGPAIGIGGSPGNCVCQCATGFAGARCDNCAEGYAGWPNCVLACSASRCNNRATEILGTFPNCTCVCARQFTGPTCERCKPNYVGATCNACAPGYINYPDCIDGCNNVTVSCFGKATAVTGFPPNCRCSCLPGFIGDTCSGCAPGYELHPFCSDACTILSVSCNASRAVAVVGPGPSCNCQCNTGFDGFRCNSCRYGYQGNNCDQCRPGFANISGVCRDFCFDVAISCNNRAFSVANGTGGECVCNCINRFTGPRCDRCARGFTGQNCDSCVPGFINYPLCVETCTHPSVSCNGRGTAVAGSFPDCICTCLPQWTGTRCERCSRGYLEPTCMACAPGFTGYPNCVEDCTSVAVSCNNQAFAVRREPDGSCFCDCKPQFALPTCRTCFRTYTGDNCDQCADGFTNFPNCVDACTVPSASCNGIATEFLVQNMTNCRCKCPVGFSGNRCENCAAGYSGWPNCVEDCTDPAVSCRGRAFNVWGTFPNCVCNCTRQFAGATCERCSFAYNSSSTGCDECAFGFSGYPNCQDDCSDFIVSCLGHGVRLADRTPGGDCICQCLPNYAGNRCDRCAWGYERYPNCTDSCEDASVSCNGVGIYVMRQNGTCRCTCPPQYTGNTCQACAPGYGPYPQCLDSCTLVSVSCSGNAHNVTGISPNCACNCRRGFTGPRCDRCADGFGPYPLCYDNCSNALASCNGFATNVSSSAEGCVCQCLPQYAGRLCDRCAAGYANYPACTDNCSDVTVSCNSRASFVNGTGPTCNCVCTGNFAGTRCHQCKLGFALPDCTTCATGFFTIFNDCDSCTTGYKPPFCTDACTHPTISCNGYASSVEPHPSDPNRCLCRCYRGYAGDRCERCAVGFETGWPNCRDQCLTVALSCSGSAFSVRTLPTPGMCNCTCFANFTGPFCGECVPGFGPFPTCRDNCSNVNVSCSGNAVSVVARNPFRPHDNCSCTCRRGFAGRSCSMCAAGFESYPNCTDACVNVTVSCNGNAGSVTAATNRTGCDCNCTRGFAGPTCDQCAIGFVGYPRCVDNCSDVDVSCNGNADNVTRNSTSASRCICACKRGFTGLTCDRCAAGFSNYPHCFDVCTDITVTCNSRAATVSIDPNIPFGPNGEPTCSCACFRGYNGTQCETCATGYDNWPFCNPGCNSVDISCNGAAIGVNGTFPNCRCTCRPGVEGLQCERCVRGYSPWPTCVDDCSLPEVSCGGRALRIASRTPTCVCECAPMFRGDRCDQCLDGFTNFPNCVDACTNATISCRNGATAVQPAASGVPGECECTCAPRFGGPVCDRCAAGYVLYPSCIDACVDVNISCHGNGLSVTGAPGSCTCVCKPNYQGRQCDRCANGYSSYPNCTDACTIPSISCVNNATSVTGVAPACKCRCIRGFGGDRCDECAVGFSGYPRCRDNCTSAAISCSNRAYSVSLVASNNTELPPQCNCTCHPGYAGAYCELCAPGFTRDMDTDECIDACTNVNVSCHGNAVAVNGSRPGACRCECRPQFSGATCNRCNIGFAMYPLCRDACTHTAASCSSRASAVEPVFLLGALESSPPSSLPPQRQQSRTLTASLTLKLPDRCNCSCHRGYIGSRCETCDLGFAPNASTSSGVVHCIDSCTEVNVSCNGHASSVVPMPAQPGQCRCQCRPNYAGDRCEMCALGYNSYPRCIDACDNMNVSCNGFATSLSGTAGQCTCRCITGYGGPRCNECAETHEGYPNCTPRPPGPTLPAALLRLDSRAVLTAAALRTGVPYTDRTFTIRLVYDTFDVDAGRSWTKGGLANFFFECLDVRASDDFPFGVARSLSTLWTERSITDVNVTHMTLQLFSTPLFDVPETVRLSVGFVEAASTKVNCTKRLPMPRNRVQLDVEPETVDAARVREATGLLGAAGAIALVALSPSSLQDGQMLAMLGSMGCAKTQSRASRSAAGWMLTPLGFWGDKVARFLGVLLPFLFIPLVHAALVLFQNRSRAKAELTRRRDEIELEELRQQRRKLREGGDATTSARHESLPDDGGGAGEWLHPAAMSRFHFPGLSAFLMRVLLTGTTFYSVEMTREFTGSGVFAGVVGGLCVIGFAASVAHFCVRNPHELRYEPLDSSALPNPPFMRLFLPTTRVVPEEFSARFFPALSEHCRLQFVAFDVCNTIALAATAASQPASREGCIVQYSFLSVWFLVVAIVLGVFRPYRTPLINATSIAVNVFLFGIAVSSAVESDEPGGFGGSLIAVLSQLVMYTSLLRAIAGLVAILYEKRRVIGAALNAGKTAKRRPEAAATKRGAVSSDDDDDDGDDSDASSTDSLVAPLMVGRYMPPPARPSFRGDALLTVPREEVQLSGGDAPVLNPIERMLGVQPLPPPSSANLFDDLWSDDDAPLAAGGAHRMK